MMKKDKEPTHDGHRARLTDLVLKAGLENVSKIQAVEYFLTYIFPRGDVNPLAHRLLDRYGTFANIVDAEIEDLVTVKGINQRSASKIKLFSDMIFYYSTCKMQKRLSLKNNAEFLNYIEQLLRFRNTENLFMFAIDHGFKLIQMRKFDLKHVREVGVTPYELYNFISSTKLSYLAVAHNHPNGTARPSPDDNNAITYIESLISNFDCKLLDSFILGNDGIYSEKQECFLRYFDSTNNIINFFESL